MEIHPQDDPIARLHGREAFFTALHAFWDRHPPPKPTHFAPKLAGHHVDLYIYFEAIRALGGIQTVIHHNLFFHLRVLLMIPESSAVYSKPLRDCYTKFLQPCYSELAAAVTACYHRHALGEPRPSWLHARVELTHDDPGKSSLQSTNDGDDRNDDYDDDDDDDEPADDDAPDGDEDEDDTEKALLKHPEATRAAIRARMNPNQLETLEMKNKLFNPAQCSATRLDLRNHIVRRWYSRPAERLRVAAALRGVPSRYHAVGVRVFTMLEAWGTINFGALPLALRPVSSRRRTVGIVGGGISGLIAARQLLHFGFDVMVFEAKVRAGGRILSADTDTFSAPVDLGAMIITGVIDNPLSVLARQTGGQFHYIRSRCPLFDISGEWVPEQADKWVFREYNRILAATDRFRRKAPPNSDADRISLGVAFQRCLIKRIRKRREAARRPRSDTKDIPKEQGVDDRGVQTAASACSLESGTSTSANKSSNKRNIIIIQGAAPRTRRSASAAARMTAEGAAVSARRKKRRKSYSQNTINSDSMFTITKKRDSVAREGVRRRSSRLSHGAEDSRAESGGTGSWSGGRDRSPEELVDTGRVGVENNYLIGRLLRWHIANLEYACAASIESVSLKHWDQDDPYAFRGEHVFLKDGFEPLLRGLEAGLENSIKLNTEVVGVRAETRGGGVVVESKHPDDAGGELLSCERFDAVLVTVPLGVLQAGSIAFEPPLPPAKRAAVSRLGMGGLMKVAMEFESDFWSSQLPGDTDMFGALRQATDRRGAFYMFWNMIGATGHPVLIAMVTEPVVSAASFAALPDRDVVSEALDVLKRRFREAVTVPVSYAVTRWGEDRFIRGAYTHVPPGSSGADYDALAAPVESSALYFAGEHTCRTNPTTCASGLISGLREAHRIADRFGAVDTLLSKYEAVMAAGDSASSADSTSSSSPSSSEDGDKKKHGVVIVTDDDNGGDVQDGEEGKENRKDRTQQRKLPLKKRGHSL